MGSFKGYDSYNEVLMHKQVRVEVARGYAMPAVCCACGAPAANATVGEAGMDAQTRARITMHFPLCTDCGHVIQAAGGWRGKAGRLRVPAEQRTRFDKVDAAVKVKPYHATADSKTPTVTIDFANPTFARAFESENSKR